MDQPTYVRALLREREGYVLHGRGNRVAEVDAELERQGVDVSKLPPGPPASPAPETTEGAPLPERAVPPKPQRPGR